MVYVLGVYAALTVESLGPSVMGDQRRYNRFCRHRRRSNIRVTVSVGDCTDSHAVRNEGNGIGVWGICSVNINIFISEGITRPRTGVSGFFGDFRLGNEGSPGGEFYGTDKHSVRIEAGSVDIFEVNALNYDVLFCIEGEVFPFDSISSAGIRAVSREYRFEWPQRDKSRCR